LTAAIVDEYVLENIVKDNPIHAEILLPFAITRLREAETVREAELSVQLRDIGDDGESQRRLHLMWSEGSALMEPLPVQERVITEWAASGIACVLVPLYARMRVLQVAQAGDSFDYWVGDGEQEYALEVSGTIRESLTGRHTAKVRQLQKNPYRIDGYVAVTRFATRKAIFSFHCYEETG
jgi:hypothetical protein